MAKVLAWIAGIFVALLAIIAVAAATMDWTPAGRWAAERLSASVGRDIRLNGGMDVDWSWTPRITLTDLSVANAAWGSEPRMAQVDRLELAIRIPPLLWGRLELPEVILTGPDLLLERNKDGFGNWVFGDPEAARRAADAAKPDERGEMPIVERLGIRDALLIYRDPEKRVDVRSRLSTAAGSGPEGRDIVRLEGEGTLADKPLRIMLLGGPLLMLRETKEPYPVDLQITAGRTRASMTGTFLEPVKLQGATLALQLQGPNLAEIFPLFGIPTPITAPYLLAGKVARNGDAWEVQDLVGRVGESDIAGWVTLEPRPERPLIRGELVSEKLRLVDLGGFIGYDPGAGGTDRPSTVPPGRLLPDLKIESDRLEAADMDLRFTGGELVVPILPLERLTFRFRLEDRLAMLDDLAVKAKVGGIGGRALLNGRSEIPSATFDVQLDGVGLKQFFAGTRFADETEGTIGGRMRVEGHGNSLAEIMASANGEMGVVMPGGQVSHLLIEAAGLDVAEGLAKLLGGDDPVSVRCAVADLSIEDGTMRSNALVFDTTDTKIEGGMTVDFDTEALAARLEAEPKDPSPLSAKVPITVGGTLAAPEPGIEAGGLALKAGAAAVLGAVATPFAAILPFIETGGGEDSPCRELIEAARNVDGSTPERAQKGVRAGTQGGRRG